MLKNKFITPDKLYEKILIKYVIIKKINEHIDMLNKA